MSKRKIALLVLASIGLSVLATALARRIARLVEENEPVAEFADPDRGAMRDRRVTADG